MSSVGATSSTMPSHPVSYAEFPVTESAETTSIELGLIGFPVGFGGWTAARMYERRIGYNNQQHDTQNTTYASTARQEVIANFYDCFAYFSFN